MDSRGPRNALIAVGVFAMIIFVISTVHGYQDALKQLREGSSSKGNGRSGGSRNDYSMLSKSSRSSDDPEMSKNNRRNRSRRE